MNCILLTGCCILVLCRCFPVHHSRVVLGGLSCATEIFHCSFWNIGFRVANYIYSEMLKHLLSLHWCVMVNCIISNSGAKPMGL